MESLAAGLVKMSCCAPLFHPHFSLYPGLVPSAVSMLLPVCWCHAIICFAPWTHFDASSAQYTGACAGAMGARETALVTVHLNPCMYLAIHVSMLSFRLDERPQSKHEIICSLKEQGLHVSNATYMFGCPQPSGTHNHAQ